MRKTKLILFFILPGIFFVFLFFTIFSFFYFQDNLLKYAPEQTDLYIHYKNNPFSKEINSKQWLLYLSNDTIPNNSKKIKEASIITILESKDIDFNTFPFNNKQPISTTSTQIVILKGEPGDFSNYPYYKKQLAENVFALSKSKEALKIKFKNNFQIKKNNFFSPFKGFLKIKDTIYPLYFKISKQKIIFSSGKNLLKDQTIYSFLENPGWKYLIPKTNSIILENINSLNQPNLIYWQNNNCFLSYQTEQSLEQIQNELKIYLANKYPKKEKIILPDKTIAFELKASPQSFNFENCQDFLCLQQDNKESFAFKKEKNFLLFLNNLDYLNEVKDKSYTFEQDTFLESLNKEKNFCFIPNREKTLIWIKNNNPLEYFLFNIAGDNFKGCFIKYLD